MDNFLETCIRQFEYYKLLGEKTFNQVQDDHLKVQLNDKSNSIATIVKHLWGNMLSRWTDFLNSDGEKEWREREAEFDNDLESREEMMKKWNEGWDCLFHALHGLTNEDLDKIIYIRNQGHTVQEAILRQLAHYSYHVGQIVFAGKIFAGENWKSLSIPRGGTKNYNQKEFKHPKERKHFTDEFLKK